jgi:hypothetical protein
MAVARRSRAPSQAIIMPSSANDATDPERLHRALTSLRSEISLAVTDNEPIDYFLNLGTGTLFSDDRVETDFNHDFALNDQCVNFDSMTQVLPASPESAWQDTGTHGGSISMLQSQPDFLSDPDFFPPPGLGVANPFLTDVNSPLTPREYQDQGSPARKTRKLDFPACQQHASFWRSTSRERCKQLLFPALWSQCRGLPGTDQPLFSSCASPLTYALSEASVDSTTRHRATRIITNLLSQNYQTSFPATWSLQILENDGKTFDYLTLPLRRLVTRE